MDVPRSSSCSPDPESSLKIYRRVFDLCDKDGNGFITKPELSDICQQYSEVEESGSLLDNVMGCLDAKHDGHISFEEFKAGFESFQKLGLEEDSLPPSALSNSTPCKPIPEEEVYESDPIPDSEEGAWREVLEKVDPQGTLTVTGVGDVWKELYRRDPSLLENFESFLIGVVSELKQSESEKDTLQHHVRRMQEQHNKEVSEMDSLLQEELQLAKVNHLQTNASQTSRLSSHYSSLLADREAVIDELSTHENDLKKALQHKVISESNLKQEKKFLLSANKELQSQLAHSSDGASSSDQELGSDSGQSRTTLHQEGEEEEGGENGGNGDNSLHHSEVERAHSETHDVSHDDIHDLSYDISHDLSYDISHDTAPYLHEAQDREQEEMKYYPPKNSPGHVAVADHVTSRVVVEEGGEGDSKPAETRSIQTGLPHPPQGVESAHSSAPQTVRSSSHSSQGVGSLGGRTVLGGVSKQYGLGADIDIPLTLPDRMPLQEDTPRPPSPRAIHRVFKVIFLGDSGVGKSSLISFLTEGECRSDVISTVGLDYSTKTLRVGEERVVFQLWDTAGQERFSNALTPVYFRRADAFVIVYDVTDVMTFQATKKWISIVKAALREDPPVLLLVGNKSDKMEERCVAMEDGGKMALELKSLFSETSALSGDNVMQAHNTLAQLLLARDNAELQEVKKRAIQNASAQRSKCSC